MRSRDTTERVKTSLTVENLKNAGHRAGQQAGARKWRVLSESSVWTAKHVRSLFATKKDGVVNRPPYLDLGYSIPYRELHSIDVLTRIIRHQDLSASHQLFTTDFLPYLWAYISRPFRSYSHQISV